MVLDSAGYLKEIIYCGPKWEERWIKCSNLINLHIAFLEEAKGCFENQENSSGSTICEVLSTKKCQIMCDDRFQEWAKQIGTSHGHEQLNMKEIKGKVADLIKDIVSTQ